MAKYTPEKLTALRRLRAARRLHRRYPLMAYQFMKEKYPDYTIEQYSLDITPKRKRYYKSYRYTKKKPLRKYGRFAFMESLIQQYRQTGDPDALLKAEKMWKVMTRPYRVLVSIKGKCTEFYLSALIPYHVINSLTLAIQKTNSMEAAEQLVNDIRSRYSGYGA